MSNTTITPNMNLVVPTVKTDPGPDWANNLNADLGILDQHNHSSGQGVQITPSGLDINADLAFNGNNAILLNTVRFNNLTSSLAGTSPNLGCLYEALNNLYFNDGVGNVIQITKTGSVNATSSGISSGTASASFVGGVLVVDANTNTPANVQGASFLFGNNTAGSNYLTLEPPNAMASNYTVTLPPINSTGGTVFMTYDSSNDMGVGPSVTGGITTTNIATGAITQSLLAPKTTGSTVGVGGVAISSSSASFNTNSTSFVTVTNLSVTLTTTGRPVMVAIQSFPGSNGFIGAVNGSGLANYVGLNILISNGTTNIAYSTVETDTIETTPPNGIEIFVPPYCIGALDTTINGAAGTYTYQVYIEGVTNSGTVNAQVANCQLVAYEI